MTDATWSLTVRDFGPIKEGSVTLAPLTVFVGRNGTGKSYMASLVWAFLNASRILLQPDLVSGPAYDAAKAMVQAIQDGGKKLVEGDDWTTVVSVINETLSHPSGLAFAEIFSHSGCKPHFVHADLIGIPKDLPVNVTVEPARGSQKPRWGRLRTRFAEGALNFTVPEPSAGSALDVDLSMLKAVALRLTPPFQPAEYIPAARTGLMLALPALIESVLERDNQDSDIRTNVTLSAPIREFLETIATYQFREPASPHYVIARYLEQQVLKGRIEEVETNDYQFAIDGSDISLPMHAASSMVTELAPLIVLLKQGIRGTLILEEPEAHLHLEAQRHLARGLVRLVNTGTPVLLTTHSDTFLQQINILMQLHEHPRRDMLVKEFGYEAADMLDPTKALGYMFGEEDGRTTISELEKTPEGFVEPLMNGQIADLTHEVLRMERT